MHKILQSHEIKQPIGALISVRPARTTWKADLGATWKIECPEKDWTPYIKEYELQHNNNFDDWSCVTHSCWGKVRILVNKKFLEDLDESIRATAVSAGTKPRQGNSPDAVCDTIRKVGGVLDTIYPSMTPTMTEEEYYQQLPTDLYIHENFLVKYKYSHWYLPRVGRTCTQKVLSFGLSISPIMVSVEGQYMFGQNGVEYQGFPYQHEVLIVKEEPTRWLVKDSENPNGLVPFSKNYKFGYPKIGFVDKI